MYTGCEQRKQLSPLKPKWFILGQTIYISFGGILNEVNNMPGTKSRIRRRHVLCRAALDGMEGSVYNTQA